MAVLNPPTLRRRAGALAVTVSGLLVFPSASLAATAPIWQDGGAQAPTSANFAAVAAYQPAGTTGELIVAVGRDSATGQAVIYRRVGGAWVHDALTSPAPTDSCLTSIAITATAAWAVGSHGGGCPGSASSTAAAPLVVRFGGGGNALAASASSVTWATVPPPSGMSYDLRAVSLVGNYGFIGAGTGALYPIDDTQAGSATGTPIGSPATSSSSSAPGSPPSPAPTEVDGVAMIPGSSPGTMDGFAVGTGSVASGQSSPSQIFDLTSTGASGTYAAAPFAPSSASPPPLAAVAAASATAAMAVEKSPASGSPSYWQPDASTGVWRRASSVSAFGFSDEHLNGVAVAAQGSGYTYAVVGDIGGVGAAWRAPAGSSPSWTGDYGAGGLTQSTPPLKGVAAFNDADLWAVGNSGTVLHFAVPPPPPPPPPPAPSDPGAGSGSGSGSGSSNGTPAPGPSPSGSSPSSPPPAVSVSQPPPPASSPPKSASPRSASRPRTVTRLLTGVAVRPAGHTLIITFLLSGRARVFAIATRHGQMVGRTRPRVLGRGFQRLVLQYTGRQAPTNLRISARPASR